MKFTEEQLKNYAAPLSETENQMSILGSPEPPVQCLRAILPEKESHFHDRRATL